eukprot:5575475-Amphidinium_carterae.1
MSSSHPSLGSAEAGDIETIPLRLLVAGVGTGVRLPQQQQQQQHLRAQAGADCDDDGFILVGEQQRRLSCSG